MLSRFSNANKVIRTPGLFHFLLRVCLLPACGPMRNTHLLPWRRQAIYRWVRSVGAPRTLSTSGTLVHEPTAPGGVGGPSRRSRAQLVNGRAMATEILDEVLYDSASYHSTQAHHDIMSMRLPFDGRGSCASLHNRQVLSPFSVCWRSCCVFGA